MPDTPAFLSDRLRAEGEKAVQFFQSLTPQQWDAVVYTEGDTWSVRAVLAHFVTAERAFLQLFQSIQAGGPGASEDFDIDRFNASQQQKTSHLTPSDLLAQFQHTRADLANWVAGLTPHDLQQTGRHPFLGQTTLAEMIKMVYRHNQIHLRDLRRLLDQPL